MGDTGDFVRTVIFCFGGRRANLELQLPFIRKIIAEHPHVEYHLWNLAKEDSDNEWLRTLSLREGFPERFLVLHEFHGPDPWTRFNDVYRYYATSSEYDADTRFIKIDDDVVFIETERFGVFENSIAAHPNAVVSAKVINNGACVPIDKGLSEKFRRLRMRLLDVHKHPKFAQMCHDHFFDNWHSLINERIKQIPTKEWLSINLIGYNADMAAKFAGLLDTPSPRFIAGREFRRPTSMLGDEGLVNTLPRVIVQGFTACHLTFGPQERRLGMAEWDRMRQRYAEIGDEYLRTTWAT